jgi:hypothetical protein
VAAALIAQALVALIGFAYNGSSKASRFNTAKLLIL